MPGTVTFQRILRAPPERIYRAFLDPDAMCKWSPPHGFTGKVTHSDPRVGGFYRMTFTNFSTGSSHSFGGEYLELVPNQRLRYSDRFESDALPGTMITTVELREVAVGTELRLEHSGIPDVVPVEACLLGWQESMQLLAQLVEPDIPDHGP